MNMPTFDSICMKINGIYKPLYFYMRILRICFQNNSKLDRIASKAVVMDRWLLAATKIYIFNCLFLVIFDLISGNYFYKDIFNIRKGITDNLYMDPLDMTLYISGLFVAPSVIALIVKTSYEKTTNKKIEAKKILAKACIASTICIPFLPIQLISHSLLNMFPLELYGRLWLRGDILLYEEFIFASSFGMFLVSIIGISFWWHKIIRDKKEKRKNKFYIYATLMAFAYTIIFPWVMTIINTSIIAAQSYGTNDRIIRIIDSVDNDDSRMFKILFEYIDYDDNLSDEEKMQVKALNMLYLLRNDVQNKNHLNAAKDYIVKKEYAMGIKEVEQLVLKDDSEYSDVLAAVNIYMNKLNQSSKNESFTKKNTKTVKIDKINSLLTLCPM